MRRRAESVDATRRRITEAAVHLHTTVGPSQASLSAIAEAAGVTRVTLYRHFEDADELFAACMSHWRALHPPPDTAAWETVDGLEPRLRRAIRELYDWYRANADDLYPIYRDAAHTPASNRARRRATNEQAAEAILAGIRVGAEEGRRLRAVVLHVVGFWTWRSLAVEGGLSPRAAVETAVGFVLSARSRKPRMIRP
jgi:AcrR family transcriptional regulator